VTIIAVAATTKPLARAEGPITVGD